MQVTAQFKLDTDRSGNTILTRQFERQDEMGKRHLPVVPIEDLPTLFEQHLAQATSFGGPRKLFSHVRRLRPMSVSALAHCC